VLTIPKLKPLAKSRSKCPSPLLLVTPISSLSQRLMISIRLLALATRQRWDNRQQYRPLNFRPSPPQSLEGLARAHLKTKVSGRLGTADAGGIDWASRRVPWIGIVGADKSTRALFLHPASPCGCALRDVATGKGAVRPGVVPAFTVSQLSSSSPRTRLRRFPKIHAKISLESGGLLPAARPSKDLSRAPRHDLTCSLLVVQDVE